MRRSPTRCFAVALVVALTPFGSLSAGAAERPSWTSLVEVLHRLGSWWTLPGLGNEAPSPGDRLDRETPAAGGGQDPYGRTLPPLVVPLDRETPGAGVDQDPYGRTPPPGIAAPEEMDETDFGW
jgi:hypothetical protein